MSFEVQQRFLALEKLVLLASLKGQDEQVSSYLCKLACVQICGTLERCMELIVTTKFEKRSPPQVSSFFKAHFRRGTNYDCENVKALLFRLDADWGHAFEEMLGNDLRMKESVNSCYAVRNSIAHGGSGSLGPSTLKQYFDAAFSFVVEIENIMSKS